MNEQAAPNASAEKATGGSPAKDASKPESLELKVKYVLYSHISYNETEDFFRFQEGEKRRKEGMSGAPAGTVTGLLGPDYKILEDLKPFLKELSNLLTNAETPGILVLFYAMGYAACLQEIAAEQRRSRDELMANHPDLRCAESVQSRLQEMFDKAPGLEQHVRVVSALDLYDTLRRIESSYAQSLIQWFIGLQEEKIRYDAPKIVEAIIRVRMIGSGAPIFRIDQDVLFRMPFFDDPGNAQLPALDLGNPIKTCVEAFRKRRDDPRMAAFVFSGSYDSVPLEEPGVCKDFYAWSRAFATRCFPALCILPKPLTEAREVADNAEKAKESAKQAREKAHKDVHERMTQADEAVKKAREKWKEYVDQALDPTLMCRFFGIKPSSELGYLVADPDIEEGIGWLGAHPLVSVISGALLCINDSAILDLPPFSNFNMNVIWIDDHLKYCLHRELRHFTTISITSGPVVLRDAKIDQVRVVKGRQHIEKLPEYVLGDYLPTLLYGSVMDAWITPDPDVSSIFLVGEVIDLPLFASKLKHPSDAVSIHLKDQLSSTTKGLLASYQTSTCDLGLLEKALVDDLNRIIQGQSLFDPQRFSMVNLRPETNQYITQKPQGSALLGLNRLLLEDAYDLELAKRTDHRIMKWRPETLDLKRKQEWDKIPKSGDSKGVLPCRLQIVLGRGRPMSPLERLHFKRQLLKAALGRITMVRKSWSTLVDNHGHPTFASAWAVGEPQVGIYVHGMTGRARGLVRDEVEAEKDLELRDLNEEVREDLMMLTEDTATYIDMTLNWSKTIQLIRSIEPGTLKTDLFWTPKG